MNSSSDSLRLPAEWEAQSGVMLTWPHDQGDWAPLLAEVTPVFQRLALEIARRETLLVHAHGIFIPAGHMRYNRGYLLWVGFNRCSAFCKITLGRIRSFVLCR